MGEQQLACSDRSYKGQSQLSEVQYGLCSIQWNWFRTVPFAEYAGNEALHVDDFKELVMPTLEEGGSRGKLF